MAKEERNQAIRFMEELKMRGIPFRVEAESDWGYSDTIDIIIEMPAPVVELPEALVPFDPDLAKVDFGLGEKQTESGIRFELALESYLYDKFKNHPDLPEEFRIPNGFWEMEDSERAAVRQAFEDNQAKRKQIWGLVCQEPEAAELLAELDTLA